MKNASDANQQDGRFHSDEAADPALDAPTMVAPGLSASDESTLAPSAMNPISDSNRLLQTLHPEPSAPGKHTRFGDFELLQEISRGGMGVVYRAREIQLNRIVALKMILAGELACDDEVKRFRIEAEAAAQLEHPGIVPIYEIGAVGGQHFYTMSFIQGAGLDQFKGRGIENSKRAARIVQQVAEAMHYAHLHGVVHRDLKPANILLDEQGFPHITDFGLAKRTDAARDLTRTGEILGTPGYMAPEQAAGDSKSISEPADIYALGGVLYFLLTGRPPFQAANVIDTLVQALDSEPTLPRTLNPIVPRPLEQICMRCLERNPTDRYASAAEVAMDLDRFLQDQPVHARPPTSIERVRRFARRSPALSVHIGALSMLLVVAQIRHLAADTNDWLHVKVTGSLAIWLTISIALHLISKNKFVEHLAGTVLLCVDAAMITVLLVLISDPDQPPGPLLVGYPLVIVAGAMFVQARRVVIVTIASIVSYLGLLIAEPYLINPIHLHVCFLIMLLAISGCLIHQVRRVRTLSDYFQSQR